MRTVSELLDIASKNGRSYLLEPEALEVCSAIGIPCPRFSLVKDMGEAVKTADKIGYPVVLKVVSPQVIHKSDKGGVVVGIKDPEELKASFRGMLGKVKEGTPNAEITGVLVEEMLPPSVEVAIGATENPQFGTLLMFGLGGVFVEALHDVSFRVAPIELRDAREMITETKAYPLLRGYRNQPPVDTDALVDILMKVSALVTEHPQLREVDLNPVLPYQKGAKAVDARMRLGQVPEDQN